MKTRKHQHHHDFYQSSQFLAVHDNFIHRSSLDLQNKGWVYAEDSAVYAC